MSQCDDLYSPDGKSFRPNGMSLRCVKSITFPDFTMCVEEIFGLLCLLRFVCDLGIFTRFVGLGTLNSDSEADIVAQS